MPVKIKTYKIVFTNLAEDNLGEGRGEVCAKLELETIASVEEVGKRRANGDAFSV